MSEEKLENWLMTNLMGELDQWETDWTISEAEKAKRPKIDRAAIQRKMDRLKDLYVNDLITMEQYRVDWEKYSSQLQQALEEENEPPAPDFSGLRSMLSDTFPAIYADLDREQRRDFWRGIIKEIQLDAENKPRITFY